MHLSLFLFLFAFATGCNNNEALTPQQPSVDSNARKGTTTSPLTKQVTGTVNGKSFSGLFTVTSFIQDGTQILAVGTLSALKGKLSGDAKEILEGQSLTVPVSFPSMQQAAVGDITAQATCQILDLTLGPLDLNLLGLVVHLDQINLTIDAQSGALLGDLLCAVANLLDPISFLGNLAAIADLLNQIVGILQ